LWIHPLSSEAAVDFTRMGCVETEVDYGVGDGSGVIVVFVFGVVVGVVVVVGVGVVVVVGYAFDASVGKGSSAFFKASTAVRCSGHTPV